MGAVSSDSLLPLGDPGESDTSLFLCRQLLWSALQEHQQSYAELVNGIDRVFSSSLRVAERETAWRAAGVADPDLDQALLLFRRCNRFASRYERATPPLEEGSMAGGDEDDAEFEGGESDSSGGSGSERDGEAESGSEEEEEEVKGKGKGRATR